jgi:branched-subunit amino acid ABC-type transport system permease component
VRALRDGRVTTIHEYLPFLVVGITTGAVYALASMGLVLTYTTSGVFNFAHGAVGMLVTYVFYSLLDHDVPTALAVVLALLVIAPLFGVVIDRVLFRRLYGGATVNYVVVSLGLLVALQGLAVVIYGPQTREVRSIFPTWTYRLPGINVGIDQTIVVGVAIAGAIGLSVFFRRTHLGLQTRAVVCDRDLTEMVGTNSTRVTTLSWMLGCSFAALAGMLIAPFVQLDAVLLTLLVVQAFGAAVVGGLRSLSLTNVGAYGIAIAGALATKLAATRPSLVGLPTALPFIVLFVALLISKKGYFLELTRAQEPGRTQRSVVRTNKVPVRALVVALTGAAILPPILNDSQLLTATNTVAYVLVLSSLSLLVGVSRQISLAHVVFVVFGATTLGHFLSAGIPYMIALPLAALVLVPVGALLALPAIRLSGLFLALATFGFGVLAQYLLFNTSFTFGKNSVVYVPRPAGLESDSSFHYFLLAVVALGVLAVELIKVSRLGRLSRALGDSPTAVTSLGVNPTATRVLIFCISAFLAAISGGLLASVVGAINQSSFTFFQSLIWVAVLVLAGTRTPGGSVLAAILLVTVPGVITSATLREWQPVFFGVGAIVFAQAPNGIAGVLRQPLDAFRRIDFGQLAARRAWRHNRRRHAERYVAALQRTG